jgi:hypothetical protein
MRAIVPRDVVFYSYAGTGYANPHAATSVGGTTYSYDNNGNVTSIGSLDYTWDWRNRLSSAERSGEGSTTYGYDHTGQRVFQATGSATTSYPNRYYNVASSSLTATTTKHIFSPDGTLLATVVGSGTSTASTTYIHTDHLGGTNVVTDEDGEVVQLWTTTPMERSASPPAPSPSSAGSSARSSTAIPNFRTSTPATTKAPAASS